MNTTILVWLAITGGLTLASLRRSTYGFSLYLFTFFVMPMLWWWGRPMPVLRYNLIAGVVFALAVVLHSLREPREASPADGASRVGRILIALAVNATLVHLVLAPDFFISLDNYVRLMKFVALFFMIVVAVRNPADFRLALWSVVLGAAFIGYEVTVNDTGRMVGGRLEGVGAAGVTDANGLASLMVTVLPLAGGLFFAGSRRDKMLVAITGPLILNVILLCSSRGALLSLFVAAISFVLTASGRLRKQALGGMALGVFTLFMLAADEGIFERFSTTFASAEERDDSAATRLIYWGAGLRMVADHPLGAGGDGYKRVYASEYLSYEGIDVGARSVHNGIINEACEWGLQGLGLRVAFLGVAALMTRRTLRRQAERGATREAVLGNCLLASLVAFVGTSIFGDYMDEEWGYWIPALMVTYARLYGTAAATVGTPAAIQPALAVPVGRLAVRRPAVAAQRT